MSTGAVPAAKERGDRGRGTSAFEMVLSPGAGIASAANGLMQGCRGLRPRRNKLKISPFPGGEERSASAGGGMGAVKKAKGRVGRRLKPPSPPADTTAAGLAGDQPDKPTAKKHLRIPGNPGFRGVSVFNSRKADYFDVSVSATVGSLMSATYFRTFSLVRLEVSILSFSVEPSSTKAYPPMVSSESVRRMLSRPVQS